MLNFWKALIGLTLIIVGALIFNWITNKRLDGEEDEYGNHTQIYTGAIGFILVGLIVLVKELMKL